VAYLYAALTSKRSFWAEIIVDYAPLVRMLRLAGLATSILRMLMLSGVVRGVFGCLKFLCSPTKEDGMDDEEKIQTNARSDKAIVDDYSTFRRYISAISLNDAKMMWPHSAFARQFCGVLSYDGSTIHVDDLPVFIRSAGLDDAIVTLESFEQIVTDGINRNIVFFDDLINVLNILRNNKMEIQFFQGLEPRRLRAKRALVLVVTRFIKCIVVLMVEFLSSLADLAVNLYVSDPFL
jgi:hypothetical protein